MEGYHIIGMFNFVVDVLDVSLGRHVKCLASIDFKIILPNFLTYIFPNFTQISTIRYHIDRDARTIKLILL